MNTLGGGKKTSLELKKNNPKDYEQSLFVGERKDKSSFKSEGEKPYIEEMKGDIEKVPEASFEDVARLLKDPNAMQEGYREQKYKLAKFINRSSADCDSAMLKRYLDLKKKNAPDSGTEAIDLELRDPFSSLQICRRPQAPRDKTLYSF